MSNLRKVNHRKMRQKDIDQKVLEQLIHWGSDLSKPHNFDFFLYFQTEETAKLAATVIEREGFEIEIQLGADKEKWLCLAMKKMVPEEEELVEIRKWFESIANELDGEYDGWGTIVTD